MGLAYFTRTRIDGLLLECAVLSSEVSGLYELAKERRPAQTLISMRDGERLWVNESFAVVKERLEQAEA